jgi:hypothetical protein
MLSQLSLQTKGLIQLAITIHEKGDTPYRNDVLTFKGV